MNDIHTRRLGSGPGWTTFLITQLGSLAASRYAERLTSLDLNPAHSGLLRAIAAQPGRSQQAVAAQMGLLPSRLVALVDELEQLKLVERRRSTSDRRNYALHLTATGEDTLKAVGQVANKHGNDFLAPLDPEERKTLGGLLSRLADHHGLTPGVHPGYTWMGRGDDTRPAHNPEAG
jgi:DNA-binding MarR family transcriptional regulator